MFSSFNFTVSISLYSSDKVVHQKMVRQCSQSGCAQRQQQPLENSTPYQDHRQITHHKTQHILCERHSTTTTTTNVPKALYVDIFINKTSLLAIDDSTSISGCETCLTHDHQFVHRLRNQFSTKAGGRYSIITTTSRTNAPDGTEELSSQHKHNHNQRFQRH
jgi:hypothetical protein